ncbi:Kdo hydroxylase family protein [Pseudomonas sp. HR96]|uniref:Kdo hydroxylase family protein n=1 Tax=Pseudomonas sp. HR96 TaxID=1027966 RepID=UPI002A758BEF|nr:Kdo hydroxylase family protein [Pseudomonas sp. HR96]WPO98353.1 Kdo hydroxylase family protein [Pseudomonas sp. HR96]
MTQVMVFGREDWHAGATEQEGDQVLQALEAGNVVAFDRLPFALSEPERALTQSSLLGSSKNISYASSTGQLKGCDAGPAQLQVLAAMLARFAASSQALVRTVLAPYSDGLQVARTSFRPQEIKGRLTSWRKDDTRLHVDSFPSSPVQGRRILRVFSNVNPYGEPRVWRVGGSFDEVASRYELPGPLWGSSQLLDWLHITKSRRTPYDHHMLRLHDSLKADPAYQSGAQLTHEFAPGTTWLVFTDQVPHAAMSGRYALEQTFLLPVQYMRDVQRAPVKVLERVLGRELV